MVKTYIFLGFLFATMALFAFLVYSSIFKTAAAFPIPPDALQGKIVFQKKACIECHTVFGNGGYLGGDLTKVYDQMGGQAIKDYLVHPPVLTGAKNKRHDQLDEQEAEAAVVYLKYLNSIDTLDWPLNSNTNR